jgi:hypothetical protein
MTLEDQVTQIKRRRFFTETMPIARWREHLLISFSRESGSTALYEILIDM